MSDNTQSRLGNAWVGALSEDDQTNWPICKQHRLWGSGSNSAKSVRNGDEFFIWKSGQAGGWLAHCRVTSDARRPSAAEPAPWPDGREYKWIFGIQVLREASTPFNPRSTDGVQNLTGILNVRLSQFPKLTAEQATNIRSLIGGLEIPIDDRLGEREKADDLHEEEIRQRTLDGPVAREQLIQARRGQGVFKQNVLLFEQSCRVTGLRAIDHLRASHIKPWSKSTDEEKIDGHNGLLLSPHIDHLFDRGWITFMDEGQLKPSPRLDPLVFSSWRIEPDRHQRPFMPKQCEFLEYHRSVVFVS